MEVSTAPMVTPTKPCILTDCPVTYRLGICVCGIIWFCLVLADHLRWDVEEDLARLLGDVPAHAVASAGRALAAALRQFAARPQEPQGQGGRLRPRCRPRPPHKFAFSLFSIFFSHFPEPHAMKKLLRALFIVWTALRYGLDEMALSSLPRPWLRALGRLVRTGRCINN